MNVYDFDQTVFYPDSSVCFIAFCVLRYPRSVLPTVPMSLVRALQYGLKKIETKKLKEQLFSFLPRLPDVQQAVEDFWSANLHRLQDWYLVQKREDDLIISASPEFLLAPVTAWLGVDLIATPMDPYTGRILGENCHDEVKPRRFRRRYPEATIERFYSDSLSDSPMAALADEAFLVRRGEIKPWPET